MYFFRFLTLNKSHRFRTRTGVFAKTAKNRRRYGDGPWLLNTAKRHARMFGLDDNHYADRIEPFK